MLRSSTCGLVVEVVRQYYACPEQSRQCLHPPLRGLKTSPGKPCFLGRKPVRDHHPMNIYLDPLFTSSSGCPITAREAVPGLSPICKLKIDPAHSVGFRAKPYFCFCCLLAIVQYTLYPPFEMSSHIFSHSVLDWQVPWPWAFELLLLAPRDARVGNGLSSSRLQTGAQGQRGQHHQILECTEHRSFIPGPINPKKTGSLSP